MQQKNFIRNICIGIVDGLTIPLALAAGLSGLVSSSSTVVVACLALAFAGAVTMGSGAYIESKKYDPATKPVNAALTIGLGYLAGGIFTTLPYCFVTQPLDALSYCVTGTLTMLFIAGYWEGRINGGRAWINAVRVAITAAVAAGAAYAVAKLFI